MDEAEATALPPMPIAAAANPPVYAPPARQWLALGIGILPLYAYMIGGGLMMRPETAGRSGVGDWLLDIVFYWGVFGTLLYAALRFVGRERPGELQTGPGTWRGDIPRGVGVFFLLLLGDYVVQLLLSIFAWESSSGNFEAMAAAGAGDLAMLLVQLGPASWLLGGLFEEAVRVFMLSRLQRIWPGSEFAWLRIAVNGVLFGLGHIYQGWDGVVLATVSGLLLANYFERRGRFLPMVIGHALIDMYCMYWWWAYAATN